MTNILWFRNDLRLHDNEAFSQAIDNDSVLLVYIYDRKLTKRDTVSSFHLKFIEESLDDLSDELKEKFGATLNIYHSDTLDVFRDLLSRYQVKNIFSNRIFKEKLSQEIDNLYDVILGNYVKVFVLLYSRHVVCINNCLF